MNILFKEKNYFYTAKLIIERIEILEKKYQNTNIFLFIRHQFENEYYSILSFLFQVQERKKHEVSDT